MLPHTNKIFSRFFSFVPAVFCFLLCLLSSPSAQAALLFTNDLYDATATVFTIDGAGTATSSITLKFGSAANQNFVWNISNSRFELSSTLAITGGISASGNTNFSGASEMHLREVVSVASLACTTLKEIVLNTTDNKIYVCTVTGNPGTWTTSSGGGSQDFEGVYTTDTGKNLVTSNGAFAIDTGANTLTFNGGTSTGSVLVGGTGTQTISVGNGAGVKTVNVGSSNTTSTTTILGGSGGVQINDSNNQVTNIGTGTSTGAVTVGGTGTQTLSFGTGAGVKTVNVGSTNTTSTTTINSGSGGVQININNNQPTNIATGTTTGTVTIGGTGTQTISIGNGAGVKTVNVGSTNTTSTTTINSGSGGLQLNANNNQPTNIGTGTTTGTVTLGGTGTQTISVGNGAGVKTVNVGSTNTTSTTTINSGSGGTQINANNNQVTNIGTGTSTGQVSLGGNANCIQVDSNTWDVSCAGIFSGVTGITSTGGINFSGATSFRMAEAASDPGTCTAGQMYFNTTTATLRLCSATNTWTSAGATGAQFVHSYDTTTQTVATANTYQDVTFNTNGQLDGWTHTTSTAVFTAAVAGTYEINYTGRAAKSGGANTTVSLRIVQNGTEVAGSQAYSAISGGTGITVSGRVTVAVAATDVIKLQLTGGTSSVRLVPGGTGTTLPTSEITITRIK